MRRSLALMSAVAVLAAALGCQHVGGKCDCGYNPSDYPIAAPTNPHAAAPVVAPAVVPAPVKPADKMPEKPVEKLKTGNE
jgi:hypothetical protein